jgi:FKBP-type peptidyl-prolyl cis-trans isomerase FklB
MPLALASVPPPVLAQKASPPAAAFPDSLKDPQAQAGYVLGLRVGAQLRSQGVTVDAEAVARGVRDALAGTAPLLSPEQVRAVMDRVQGEIIARRQGQAAQGVAFLKANGAKPGVVTTPSGLQYQVLTAGTGPKPKAGDTVVCNYRGTLIDGTEFDSSYSHGAPLTFAVGGVIKGWTEALQLMPVGSKWRLFIPADLAYGDKGAGDKVGPGAVLIFDVELLSIKAG